MNIITTEFYIDDVVYTASSTGAKKRVIKEIRIKEGGTILYGVYIELEILFLKPFDHIVYVEEKFVFSSEKKAESRVKILKKRADDDLLKSKMQEVIDTESLIQSENIHLENLKKDIEKLKGDK